MAIERIGHSRCGQVDLIGCEDVSVTPLNDLIGRNPANGKLLTISRSSEELDWVANFIFGLGCGIRLPWKNWLGS